MNNKFLSLGAALLLLLGLTIGCSSNSNSTNATKIDGDKIENQLKQANLGDVNVNVDNDKQVVTLKGDVQSDEQKSQAEQIAKNAAPTYVVANEIGVRPEGASDQAAKVNSNQDDAIKSDWKALEAKNNWGNQHINADVKNGVLTLKGDVNTQAQREKVEKAAAKIPNVTQVVNELDVKSAGKRHKPNAQTASD